jgi:hypothetical protein
LGFHVWFAKPSKLVLDHKSLDGQKLLMWKCQRFFNFIFFLFSISHFQTFHFKKWQSFVEFLFLTFKKKCYIFCLQNRFCKIAKFHPKQNSLSHVWKLLNILHYTAEQIRLIYYCALSILAVQILHPSCILTKSKKPIWRPFDLGFKLT